MATEKCMKCGAETDHGGDLHCRKIFIERINELLSLGEPEKAAALYNSESFDENWKKHYLLTKGAELEKVIMDKEERVEKEQQLALSRAQNEFAELANKYHVDVGKVVDKAGPTQLAEILNKLEDDVSLGESDLNWLEGHMLFELLANYHYEVSKKYPGNGAWSLAKACKFFRKAQMPQKVIHMTDVFSERNILDPYADSAVYTSRGGAFRDIRDYDMARQSAEQAIPSSSPHPYNLLGAISYDEEKFEEGDKWFADAIKRGSSTDVQDREIRSILRGSTNRSAVIDYLLNKDPDKYAWVRTFQKS